MSEAGSGSTSFVLKVPEGDNRSRLVCETCGFIHYVNPKIVVGAVCRWQEKVLLCRRAINPRRGFWTIPAGFLEEHETPEQGALREAHEEARAALDLRALLAVYSVPRISQVQLIYLADLRSPEVAPGDETIELALFRRDEVPWSELAFPSVHWALHQSASVDWEEPFPPFTNPPGETGDMRSPKTE